MTFKPKQAIVLALMGLLGSGGGAACAADEFESSLAPFPSFSLKAVEANPIPKAEHFLLWKEVALKSCSESQTRFNLAEKECLTVISKRADTCASQLSNQSPSLISTNAVDRDVGRKFVHCATPFYFCKGVEVKSEEEVRANCK